MEHQVGARLVELATPYLVYDEAGGLHEGPDQARRAAPLGRCRQPVPELAGLYAVGLEAPQAALAPVRLAEVRLALM